MTAFLSTVVGLGLLAGARFSPHTNLVVGVTPLTTSPVSPAVRAPLVHVTHQLPRLPVAPLYSRSDDSDPLEHETRQALVRFVRETPGLPLTAVSDHLELPRSTVRYHVRILEQEQELMTENVLGRRRVFPACPDSPPAVIAAMQDAGTRRLLLTLAQLEPAPLSVLADNLEKASSTVSYHLSRLENAGVVARERDGSQTLNRLTPTVRAAIESEPATGEDEWAVPDHIGITY